jgi:cell division protein FtsB
MSIFVELRKRIPLVAVPLLGITLVFYFAYHLVQGDRGLVAWLRLNHQLKQAQASLESAHAERDALDRRVELLRPEHLDRDMLDERARATLNLAGPNEIVILRSGAGR